MPGQQTTRNCRIASPLRLCFVPFQRHACTSGSILTPFHHGIAFACLPASLREALQAGRSPWACASAAGSDSLLPATIHTARVSVDQVAAFVVSHVETKEGWR